MGRKGISPCALFVAAFLLALIPKAECSSIKETVLYEFPQDASTGFSPVAALLRDGNGNLYGTTLAGGPPGGNCLIAGCGTIFELSPPPKPGEQWTHTILYTFQGEEDGIQPACTLMMDSAGNLFGTSRGLDQTGVVVFELSPPSKDGAPWIENTLYTFENLSFAPSLYTEQGTLVMDSAGNLYGASYWGGSENDACQTSGCGAVFEVSPPVQPGGPWTGTTTYAFQGGADGTHPNGKLVFDGNGTLYGTTSGDRTDPCGCGTIFQLMPPFQRGGAWTENVLYTFNGVDGEFPFDGLIRDNGGNLYGSTSWGGPPRCNNGGRHGCGSVFQLSPPSKDGGSWTETVLYNFYGPKTGDGQQPMGSMLRDRHGNLYGTTWFGGLSNAGTVFELVPPKMPGALWHERQYSLEIGNPGSVVYPVAGLIFGPGTAVSGTASGSFDGGGVFSISP